MKNDKPGKTCVSSLGGPSGDKPRAHGQTVLTLAFSPDGRSLASGSSDGTIRIWSVPLQRQVTTLTFSTENDAHGDSGVISVAFSPQGDALAAISRGGVLRVFRAIEERQSRDL